MKSPYFTARLPQVEARLLAGERELLEAETPTSLAGWKELAQRIADALVKRGVPKNKIKVQANPKMGQVSIKRRYDTVLVLTNAHSTEWMIGGGIHPIDVPKDAPQPKPMRVKRGTWSLNQIADGIADFAKNYKSSVTKEKEKHAALAKKKGIPDEDPEVTLANLKAI